MPIELDNLNPLYRHVFADTRNGTPDNISKVGCLALSSLGANAWNAWRKDFPTRSGKVHHGFAVTSGYENTADFRNHVFENPMDFSLFNFGANAQFENAQFQRPASFDLATFENDANFELAKFEGGVRFQATKFEGDVSFKCAEFRKLAFFSHAQFGNRVTFIGAKFSGQADFNEVVFGEELLFDHATFDCPSVSFLGGSWESWSSLYPAKMVEEAKTWATGKGLRPGRICLASFDGVKFSGSVNFSANEFVGKTRFSCSTRTGVAFWPERDDEGQVKPDGNGKVKELARFESRAGIPLVFSSPPIFHNCKFNQDITFDGAQFPKATGFEGSARAYRTLKLAFAQQQAIRQEQQFFRLEMAEEAKGASWRQRYLYRAYDWLGDYGFSLWRPLLLLFGAWVLFAFLYGTLAGMIICLPFQTGCHISQTWVEFSLLQGLPIFGFDSIGEKFHKGLFGHEVPTTSVLVGVIFHKAISLLALFLAGLALRNLFKMK